MAKVSIYRHKRDGMLHLRFTNMRTHASRALNIKVLEDQWDGKKVINHAQAQEMNLSLTSILTAAQLELLKVVNTTPTRFAMPTLLRDKVCEVIFPAGESYTPKRLFIDIMAEFRDTHDKKSTRSVYTTTIGIIEQFDRNAICESINGRWLSDFRTWLSRRGYSTNYRAIQERNIRAAFNYAIDNELTTNYPFRKWKVEVGNARPRDIMPDELRKIYSIGSWTTDIFTLQFLLMGINLIDLYNLTKSNYKRGRIQYTRQKTGKWYDIKVHPMAAAILEKYPPSDNHLLGILDRWSFEWFKKAYNRELQSLEDSLSLSVHMTSYVSRYSFASIADSLDIPPSTIARCLGHTEMDVKRVTLGYIHQEQRKVDEANEKVVKYVFKGIY